MKVSIPKHPLLIAFGLAMLCATSVQGEPPEFAPRVVIPRAFPAIKDAPVSSAADADLADNELVLGVVVNGEARAYPINMLTGPKREIINDQLGERRIAATW